jgi:membrane-bound lytic murein transglycosylase F
MNAAVPPTHFKLKIRRRTLAALACAAGLFGVLSTCSPRQDAVAQLRTMGVLRVATINSPTTYYIGAGGETGYEFDLVKGFADQLGVRLEIVLAPNQQAVIEKVRSGAAHLGAAGLSISQSGEHELRFTPPVNSVVPELIYLMGQARPRSLDELNGDLAVAAGSDEETRLRQLKARHPELTWKAVADASAEDLLFEVAEGRLAYTVASSDLVSINQRYYPRLAIAFPLAKSQELAWALPPGDDHSLLNAATNYLRGLSAADRERLRDRHFGHAESIGYFSSVTLAADVETKLPRYRKMFEAAAAKHDLDWRFLAAIGYQESHWDPHAVSPTGVRGLMMLTGETAEFLNVANREDPAQSIEGGARYFRRTLNTLPAEIAEPDRSWMALASYNMGLGHVLDARKLTAELGGDPGRWLDVSKSLPLLTKPRWFSKTQYGYARGYEGLAYVTNVRTYYDMLVWMTTEHPAAEKSVEPEPVKKKKKAKPPLNINTPIL